MGIIGEFNNGKVIYKGKKLISARKIMNILGYDDWGSFNKDISNITRKIEDDDFLFNNFYFLENGELHSSKSDILFTIHGTHYLLNNIVVKKDKSFKILLSYVNEMKETEKELTNEINIRSSVFIIVFLICFLYLVYYIYDSIKLAESLNEQKQKENIYFEKIEKQLDENRKNKKLLDELKFNINQ